MTSPTPHRAVLITGAAGFIGSNLVRTLRKRWPDTLIVSYDALTYSGSLLNLAPVLDDPLHIFVKGDITDRETVRNTLQAHSITGIIHLAAESHVDRSVVDPLTFVSTNVLGTSVLLHEARTAWKDIPYARFHHVSTDEVFGSLGHTGHFNESTPYDPHSPYSASKASSDHLVRAWNHTYHFPCVITNCSNNYGPHQFPEKLIPLVITRALQRQPIPIYGTGENVRDWLYVDDHCTAIATVFERGELGATYCVGGDCEVSNIDLVRTLLNVFDDERKHPQGHSLDLITFVKDRPGHDFRYAIDTAHIRASLGWTPTVQLQDGLQRTVQWYLQNPDWIQAIQSGDHRDFERLWYAERAGASS